MRIAIISDVDGNLTALEAVVADISQRGVDQVFHAGDLALMGPRPAEVVDRITELGWPGVVGNTDELLWRPELREVQLQRAPALAGHLQLLFDAYAADTRRRLGSERIAWLRQLPAELRVEDLTILHAAPSDLWRAPLPRASDEELLHTFQPLATKRAVYGHIHRPFCRHVGAMTIANSGSVGMSWDGDPRAAYLLVDDHTATVIRIPYDLDAERRALDASGHPDASRLSEMRSQARFLHPGGG